MNLLSFGEEAEEEEKELATINVRIRSSHDVLDDPRLLKEENADEVLVMTYALLYISSYYANKSRFNQFEVEIS